jgi:GTP-binding protein
VVTKLDLPVVRQRLGDVQHCFAAHGYDILALSAATGEGIPALISQLAQRLQHS